jgi:abortive infection bacteriophage resistance protein
VKFTKAPLSLPDLVAKLEGRGLAIPDKANAEHYLRFIGYYRLSAYALPFQESHLPDKPFRAGTSFDDILNLYRFDRELRLLVMDAIERIEVAVRNGLMHEMCLRHGSHWFMDAGHFHHRFDYARFIHKIEQELAIKTPGNPPRRPHNETFINHYYAKYGDPYLPPAWMVAETLSLGTCSLVYENLKSSFERQAIANPFNVNESILINWLHVLTYVRNICAHHGRLWNRRLVIKVKIANKHKSFLTSNSEFYAVAVVIYELLGIIAPGTDWSHKLAALIQQHPFVDLTAMGFPVDWEKEPFWKLPPKP